MSTHNTRALAALPPLETYDDPEAGVVQVRDSRDHTVVLDIPVAVVGVPGALALADLIVGGPALLAAARDLLDVENGGPHIGSREADRAWEGLKHEVDRIETAKDPKPTRTDAPPSPAVLAERLRRVAGRLGVLADGSAPRFTERKAVLRVAEALDAITEEAASDYAAHVQEGGRTMRQALDETVARRDELAAALAEIENVVERLRDPRGGGP
jgi:hypothetical protein